MKKYILRDGALIIASSLLIALSFKEKCPKLTNDGLTTNDRESDFSYSNGDIYIGDLNFINQKQENASVSDVFVVDERLTDDPNMIILDSYRIKTLKEQKEILKCLLEYEALYPTDWDRSLYSMELEWTIHNILYDLDYEKERTKSVDLNNDDEFVYRVLSLFQIVNTLK